MWDENKFFEDFKNQSGKIRPNKEFVDKTVELVNNGSKMIPFRKIRVAYTAVAAIVVFVAISGLGIMSLNKDSIRTDKVTNEKNTFHQESYAGKNGDKEIRGVVVEPNDVTEILQMLEDKEVIVTDAEGNPLTEEQRQKLTETVRSPKIPDEKKLDEILGDDVKIDEYKLIGDDMVIIKLINECYIVK